MTDQTPIASSDSPAVDAQPIPYASPSNPEHASDRMTRGDVVCLAVRIIGFYMLVQSLPWMVSLIDFLHADLQLIVTNAIPLVAVAGMGFALIIFPRPISRWLLPRTAVVASGPPGHAPAQFQAIAFSIVGVLLVGWSAPFLVYLIAKLFSPGTGNTIQIASAERIGGFLPSLLHYAIECALGVWLFFGSKRLAEWWWRMRHPEFQYVEAKEELSKANEEPGKD